MFFMDDLKVCGKDYAEIEGLVSSIPLISQYTCRNGIWDKDIWCCRGAEEGEVV